jgi:hypothetical protein
MVECVHNRGIIWQVVLSGRYGRRDGDGDGDELPLPQDYDQPERETPHMFETRCVLERLRACPEAGSQIHARSSTARPGLQRIVCIPARVRCHALRLWRGLAKQDRHGAWCEGAC